ncbi:hypothetical protein [Salarchaeum sp. JOR-1]|nr:hypothetical protein [Salarchaeum sp. JOR-1]
MEDSHFDDYDPSIDSNDDRTHLVTTANEKIDVQTDDGGAGK